MAEMTIYERYAREGDAAVCAGNYREAEACWYTAMKIAEYFGEHDPRLLESMEKLAEVYGKMERHREAEKLRLAVGKIRNRVTGTRFQAQGPFNNHANSISL